jgi:hypothetical protein
VTTRERMLIRAKAPLGVSFAGGGTHVSPFVEREGGASSRRRSIGTLMALCDRETMVK